MIHFEPQDFTQPLRFGKYLGKYLNEICVKDKEYVIDLIINSEFFYIMDDWHLRYDVFVAHTINNKWSSNDIEECRQIFIEYKIFPNSPDALVPLLVKVLDANQSVIMRNYEKYKEHQSQQIHMLSASFQTFVSKIIERNSYSSHLESIRINYERDREDDMHSKSSVIDEVSDYDDNLDINQQSEDYWDNIDLDF